MKIHEKLEIYFYEVKKLGDSWNYSFAEVYSDDEFHFVECLEKTAFIKSAKFFLTQY